LRQALTGVGLGLLPLPSSRAGAASDPPRIQRHVRLGRTGLEISDIGFGSSRLRGAEELVHHALERGINYFDTAESYTGGVSETTLGRALRGKREQVVIASKVEAEADASRDRLMESLEGSLKRLRTDRIDVYFNHAVNDVARLKNPEWPEFLALAKQQGKIRFAGMSGHGGRLVECVDHALDHDLVDVLLLAYNFGQDPAFYQKFTARFDFVARQPDLPRVLAKAKGKDVGVVAMKTLMGARLNDMRPYERGGASFAQAAFRWVLSDPHVDALVVTMKTREGIDEYLGGSGWKLPSRADLLLLASYVERNGALECRYGCDACASACPHAVPISGVLRSRMYAEDYGDQELAHTEYVGLGAAASPCLGCAERSCSRACPHGLDVASLTLRTHRSLAQRIG
jgi:predicted aldo/keto reductase-like oxidoreductase